MTISHPRLKRNRVSWTGFFVILLFLPLLHGCGSSKSRVVLYCSQDQEFAEEALGEFTRRTGLEIAPRYDTEANKSVGLYEELVREKDRPRCDVFWNNEILAMIRLQRMGLLQSYASPAAEPYPEFTKSKDKTWQAFAARARVLLVNTDRVKEGERPRSLLDLDKPRWKNKVAMAKPIFGTTATQAACLFEVLGKDKAQEFYRGLRANEVVLVAGNKQVAEGVANGLFDVGLTDTDDAVIEVKKGKPVIIVFPDREGSQEFPRLGTLFIPNTVAIIRGSPNVAGARKLVDYLLSEEVEARLARSASAQIPLNPNVKERPHEQIETPATVKPMAVDFDKAADLWDEAIGFLRKEFLQP